MGEIAQRHRNNREGPTAAPGAYAATGVMPLADD
jgi:hypothetical protein